MGGFVKAFTAPFRAAGALFSGKNPIKPLAESAPLLVGLATANPWAAAAAGAASGAANGGLKGAAIGALSSGIGGWLGKEGAFHSLQNPIALGMGKTNYVRALTGLGAAFGSGVANQFAAPAITAGTAPNGAPINIPTFEQIKKNAIVRTQEAFDREGVYHLLNPFRRFNREIPPTERDRFPSLKKTAKERAKQRIRNG